jgi:hypothetical protein
MRSIVFLFLFICFECKCQENYSFEENGKYGILNMKGDTICKAIYDFPVEFYNNIGVVVEDFYIVLVNKMGKEINRFENYYLGHYNYNHEFSNGLLAMYDSITDKFGFIDEKGVWRIKPIYYRVLDFKNGVANVWENPDIYVDIGSDCGTPVEHSKWGIIDTLQRYIVKPKFPDPAIINQDEIIFILNQSEFIYDLKGRRKK